MTAPNGQELPTVHLIDDAMYWVKPRYGDNADRWTVAKWQHGCFWGVDKGEVSPSVICGPIPHPAGLSGDSPSEASAGNPARDHLFNLHGEK